MSGLLVVVGIAGMFLLLIAPHEGGHFLFAKLFKVRVIEFSVGAGTRLWSTTRNGTLYAIRALPILGYVRMGGMEAGDFDDPNGFHRKPAWQRILILIGGPLANFVVAIVIVTVFGLTQLNDNPGKVVAVAPGTPAAAAGFRSGDTMKAVNGAPITDPGQLRKAEDAAPGAALAIGGVGTDGKEFSRVVVPANVCDQQGKNCDYQIGIQVAPLLTAAQAVKTGVTFPYTAVSNIVVGLGQLMNGAVPGGLLGPNGVTGPIGIGYVAKESVSAGPDTYFFFVALLSVALGFTNLLPFLALDGGRVVVVVIEALRRKPFDRAAELNFQRFGLVALLGIAALISFLDIQRIMSGQFPGLR